MKNDEVWKLANTRYSLNIEQALIICMLAETKPAEEVRNVMLRVFLAWVDGKLGPVSPSYATEQASLKQDAERLPIASMLRDWQNRKRTGSSAHSSSNGFKLLKGRFTDGNKPDGAA